MLSRRSTIHLCVLAGLGSLISLGGRQVSAQAPAQSQAGSAKFVQAPDAGRSGPASTGKPASRELFGQHCAKCHGANGIGSSERGNLPEIPNFTEASWQALRTDAQLLTSILDGKGTKMPSWREKISDEQARGLVAYVRTFAPTKDRAGPEKPEDPSAASFNKSYRRLQEQMDDLKKQFRAASKVAPGSAASKASESPQREVTHPPAPTATGKDAYRKLFGEHCVKCHGADGTGSPERGRQPKIPNFTDASWQTRRSDAELLTSILEGKPPKMPTWRGKISDEQARGLVAYVRTFAPTTGSPKGGSKPDDNERYRPLGEDQQEPGRIEPAEAEAPKTFLSKLIRWLGKFHPPAVHFPIALLAAAAVAELLRMATGNRTFDAVSRYCVWFGTATALLAGALGWFSGGFRLSDTSWIVMTHRWLGTSTVACAVLVLVLSELSLRPDRYRTRAWFRGTLLAVPVLVLVTGFFGGAVVFGLDHYTWPP